MTVVAGRKGVRLCWKLGSSSMDLQSAEEGLAGVVGGGAGESDLQGWAGRHREVEPTGNSGQAGSVGAGDDAAEKPREKLGGTLWKSMRAGAVERVGGRC